MKYYVFTFSMGHRAEYKHECDADAMMHGRDLLETMNKISSAVSKVDIWEFLGGGKYRYVQSFFCNGPQS